MTKNVFNKIKFIMQIPLKVITIKILWHQAWPHNDLRHLKNKAQQTRIVSLSSQPIPNERQFGLKMLQIMFMKMWDYGGCSHAIWKWLRPWCFILKEQASLDFFRSFQPQPQRPKTLRVCCANAHKRLEAVVEVKINRFFVI